MVEEKVHIPDYPEKERERIAVNRLFTDTASPLSWTQGWSDVSKITLPWAVVGLRIPYHYIDGGEDRGDIDGLLIPLTVEEILQKEGFKPSLDYIEAIEVKYSSLSRKNKLKSPPGFYDKEQNEWKQRNKQKDGRNQALKLCEAGFDQASVFHIVSTKPKEYFSSGMISWFVAGDDAGKARGKTKPQIYFEDTDPFGTILLTLGAVPERREDESGWGPSLLLKKTPPPNPYKAQGERFRKALEEKLQEIFSRGIEKINPPVLVLACSKCPNIYVSKVGPDEYCPLCSAKPR